MTFDSNYYDDKYFSDLKGKEFHMPDGSVDHWGYKNPEGEWLGCEGIVKAWKDIFGCKNVLDVGAGRGTFVGWMRKSGIEAYGFDYSRWAVEHHYPGCKSEWLTCMDATKRPWPYGDKSFNLVIVLDLLEHIYLDDIDNVLGELFRVGKKYLFIQVATIGGGSGSGIHDKGYILKKGEKIPIELEGCAVAGHVTVQNRQFWIDKLIRKNRHKMWRFRDDLVSSFIEKVNKVDPLILSNWLKNTLICMERV